MIHMRYDCYVLMGLLDQQRGNHSYREDLTRVLARGTAKVLDILMSLRCHEDVQRHPTSPGMLSRSIVSSS
jgi:hypothetical protein